MPKVSGRSVSERNCRLSKEGTSLWQGKGSEKGCRTKKKRKRLAHGKTVDTTNNEGMQKDSLAAIELFCRHDVDRASNQQDKT